MRYRFLAGRNIRPSLQELRVGGDGYEIKEVNGEYFLRHGKGIMALTKQEFDKYFEPFIDYGVEGDGKYEDPQPMIKQPKKKERVVVINALSDKRPVQPIVKEEEPISPLREDGEGQLLLF